MILKLHIWGGLGSQLYGINTALRLIDKFPSKSIKLVFHSGGVTSRNLEFEPSFLNLKYISINDFRQPKTRNPSSYHLSNIDISIYFKKILKRLAIALQVIVYLDSEEDFAKIKIYTLEVRGHYSNLSVPNKNIESIYKCLVQSVDFSKSATFQGGKLALHYRLGDLLDLESKSPISIKRIERIISQQKMSSVDGIDLYIFSDSPDSAAKLFNSLNFNNWKLHLYSLSPQEILVFLGLFETFVGTNSKISIWITLFRLQQSYVNNFLPIELRKFLLGNLQTSTQIDAITFY